MSIYFFILLKLFSLKLNINYIKSYKWLIYLQCKAGGTYNPIAGLDQHLNGDISEFNYFMKDKEAFFDLDRRYTWVKCNKDFKGYYATDYSRNIFSAFTHILLNKPEVNCLEFFFNRKLILK